MVTPFSAKVRSVSQARSQTHEHGGFSDFQCVCLYVHSLYTYIILHSTRTLVMYISYA